MTVVIQRFPHSPPPAPVGIAQSFKRRHKFVGRHSSSLYASSPPPRDKDSIKNERIHFPNEGAFPAVIAATNIRELTNLRPH